MKIQKICPTCKNEFLVIKSREKSAKFCSVSCIVVSNETKKKISKAHKGKPKSELWKKRMSFSKLENKNPLWKGENASISAKRIWVRKNKNKQRFCSLCKKESFLELFNVSKKNKRDINDYIWLCHRCSMIKSGRMKNLNRKGNKSGYMGTPEERFWKFIKKGKPNDCWEWIKSKNEDGYGNFNKNGSAHRFSYELHFGKIPKGMKVLHRCDNPPCVNPKHLFLGTQTDNMRDMVKKGRNANARGELCGMAKFTQKQVDKIRKIYSSGKYTQEELCKKYHVSLITINRLLRRVSYN